ncbi:MAG: type II toxin-antitoxin system RelE/ParE family toxin [Elusimicrobiota bacterium]|jgi:putative addiction module killer protein|nr:type II toxin-antitoxin system RelE/ParE family toxin [Elusimicrobiota bacterium]
MFIIKPTKFFTKWFEKQSREIRIKVSINIERLSVGNFSNCKMFRDGVSELKINYAKGIRVYYTKKGETLIILLTGGADKKHQQDDLEKAVKIKDFIGEGL